MADDYYQILEVPRTASAEDIKKSFRKLARTHHPDVNPGNKAAEERFKRINNAFEVLSDPQKRKLYDEFGEDAAKLGFDEKKAEAFRAYRSGRGRGGGGIPYSSAGGAGVGADFDLGDLFGEIFGRSGGGGFDINEVLRRQAGPRSPGRGEDITAQVSLSLAEAVTGTERTLAVQRPGRCQRCNGKGEAGATGPCPTCKGSGRLRRSAGMPFSGACPTCNGTGRAAEPCPDCGGDGVVEENTRLTVKVPAGVQTGSRVRLAGQGAAGTRGGPPGDLYLETEVAEHPLVRREGDDLYLDLPITVSEAVLGAEVKVPTFQGEVTVKVPALSQSGRKMRLKGRGAPSLKGGTAGDLYLLLQVKVPEEATPEVKAAAEALARAYPRDVRQELKL
ncbi:molecular chaperone DnaJ [Stigmatella hybrida]|uniref:molecular chaperone DnaJ n=1 Tax=Stigmatella hybrida TaxID=394097 RepID=UPI001CDB230D|nr:molecular chaperone DnaJ [Stigmatella hybrida]